MSVHPTKFTFAEMRGSSVRGLPVYRADHRCNHSIAISADNWPDGVRLSDIEHRFVCEVCGKRGADVRLDFNWDRQPTSFCFCAGTIPIRRGWLMGHKLDSCESDSDPGTASPHPKPPSPAGGAVLMAFASGRSAIPG